MSDQVFDKHLVPCKSDDADLEELRKMTLSHTEYQCARYNLLLSYLNEKEHGPMLVNIYGRLDLLMSFKYRLDRAFGYEMNFASAAVLSDRIFKRDVEDFEEEWRDQGFDAKFNTNSEMYVASIQMRINEIRRLVDIQFDKAKGDETIP